MLTTVAKEDGSNPGEDYQQDSRNYHCCQVLVLDSFMLRYGLRLLKQAQLPAAALCMPKIVKNVLPMDAIAFRSPDPIFIWLHFQAF